jgi:TPR repeat protein
MQWIGIVRSVLAAAVFLVTVPAPVGAQDDAAMSAAMNQAMEDATRQDDYGARERAVTSFEKLCAAGQTKACFNAGVLSAQSYESDAAFGWMKKACDGGKLIACYYVADKMTYGETANLPSARALFGRACAQGLTPACLRFASMLESDEGGPEDPRKAFDVLKRACAAPSGVACERLANTYRYRDGFAVDDSVVRATLETACGLNTWSACSSLAQMLREGAGGPVDEPRATDLLYKVCIHGENSGACDTMLLALDK